MSTETATKPITLDKLQEIVDQAPYHRWLGLRVTSVDASAGTVTTVLPFKPEFDRADGTSQFHGGIIAALIDTTGDLAVATVAGGGVPTIGIHIDYLRPALGSLLSATARIRRAGRTLAVVDIEVKGAGTPLVAIGRGNYSTRAG